MGAHWGSSVFWAREDGRGGVGRGDPGASLGVCYRRMGWKCATRRCYEGNPGSGRVATMLASEAAAVLRMGTTPFPASGAVVQE